MERQHQRRNLLHSLNQLADTHEKACALEPKETIFFYTSHAFVISDILFLMFFST
jgi:hypothetical protein